MARAFGHHGAMSDRQASLDDAGTSQPDIVTDPRRVGKQPHWRLRKRNPQRVAGDPGCMFAKREHMRTDAIKRVFFIAQPHQWRDAAIAANGEILRQRSAAAIGKCSRTDEASWRHIDIWFDLYMTRNRYPFPRLEYVLDFPGVLQENVLLSEKRLVVFLPGKRQHRIGQADLHVLPPVTEPSNRQRQQASRAVLPC